MMVLMPVLISLNILENMILENESTVAYESASTPWSAAAWRRFWSAATDRRIVEPTQAGEAATGRDRPKRCQTSALRGVVALDLSFL